MVYDDKDKKAKGITFRFAFVAGEGLEPPTYGL